MEDVNHSQKFHKWWKHFFSSPPISKKEGNLKEKREKCKKVQQHERENLMSPSSKGFELNISGCNCLLSSSLYHRNSIKKRWYYFKFFIHNEVKVIVLKGPKMKKLGTHQFCLLILNTAPTSSISVPFSIFWWRW